MRKPRGPTGSADGSVCGALLAAPEDVAVTGVGDHDVAAVAVAAVAQDETRYAAAGCRRLRLVRLRKRAGSAGIKDLNCWRDRKVPASLTEAHMYDDRHQRMV